MENKIESTVFKRRQKVYDQIFKPNIKGEIRYICVNPIRNYIIVDFEDDTALLYTFEGVMYDLENNYKHLIPTLSVKPYSVDMKGFSQEIIVSPPTVEDAVEWAKSKGDFYIAELDYHKELYTNKEMFNAFEALKCLVFLRDCYNKGWKPDWTTDTWKYFISLRRVYTNVVFEINSTAGVPHVLSFKNGNIAKKFLEEQRELLEMAKPLL